MSNGKEQVHFITQLNSVPATGLARIPILVTGSWVKGGREVSFTRDELETAIENFHKLANHDLNVDYDHASEDLDRAAGAPTPSAGRIVALDPPEAFAAGGQTENALSAHGAAPAGGFARAGGQIESRQTGEVPRANSALPVAGLSTGHLPGSKGRWILFGRYEPTDRARQLIRNREYRYVSAAFAKDYPDRKTGQSQGLTLTSVALTNQPFLDELPEVWLSVTDGNSPLETKHSGLSFQFPVSSLQSPRLSAEQGGTMATLNLKCSAEGAHEAYDGDRKVGEIDGKHLCEYAAQHAGGPGGTLSARGVASNGEAYARFAREIGAEGRSREEIRGLITLALHPAEAEATLLAQAIGEGGKLDNNLLDELDDTGRISRSAWRRAKDAEQRVQTAFHRGQITPAMLATGAPMRLALADSAAFKALIEDRPSPVRPNSVVGLGGSGAETGESPRQVFARLVETRKQELLLHDNRLGELEAHRKAGALVAKENPDLLKTYRADAKSA